MNRQQAFLDLLSESGDVGLWSFTAGEPSVWADANAMALLAAEQAHTLESLLQSLRPARRRALSVLVQQALEQQSQFACSVSITCANGSRRQLGLRGRWQARAGFAAGELLCVVERQRIRLGEGEKKRLQDDSLRLQRFQNALAASPVSLFEQDRELRYRWIYSPRIGSNAQALIGKRANDVLMPESAQLLDQTKQSVMQSGTPLRARFDLRYRDGTVFRTDTYMAPIWGANGQVSGLVSVSVDMAESAQRDAQLLAAFEQAPLAVVLTRLSDGGFVYVNAHFERLFGYTKADCKGSSPLKLQLWYPLQSGRHFMELLNAHGHVRNRILHFRHKDGHIHQVVLTAEKVEIQGETLLLGMISDYTDLEEVRHRLAFSEARYRLLAEASSEGVALVRNGIVVDANEQLAKMLGVPREGLMGKPMHQGVQAVLDSMPASDSSPDAAHGVYNYVRTDGSMISLETRSRALMQNGELMHVATLSDKTQQVQSERSLKDMQASFDHLMASNIVGMMVLDASGAVLEANDYVLDLLQRTRGEQERGAINWIALTPASLQLATPGLTATALRSAGAASYELPMARPDGTVVHLLVAVAPLPGSVDRALVIALDITKQKEHQAELQQINSRLEVRTLEAEHAQAVKTLFLSSISHELRTPLHTILGYVRLLRKKAVAEDAQQLGIVERRATYLLRLIDDLLEFNHTLLAPENLHEDDVNLEGFVRSLAAMFSKLARQSGNAFSLKMAPGLPGCVAVDEGRLEQVLRILVDNACKYTTEGSVTLTLSRHAQRLAPGYCSMAVKLEDTGRGIAAEDLPHIFDPLRRGSNAQDRPGLGLGLAIARQWVERMGGRLQVHSAPGRGSCFHFVLVLQVVQETLSQHAPVPALPVAADALVPTLYAPMNLPPLSEADLAMLGQLIGMGRMGRIGTWARQLASSKPELQDVAEHLAGLAANAEVDKLERLYQNWLA